MIAADKFRATATARKKRGSSFFDDKWMARALCAACGAILLLMATSWGQCTVIDPNVSANTDSNRVVQNQSKMPETSMSPATQTCANAIASAKTAAKLEQAVIECLKLKLAADSIRSELQKRVAELMQNKSEIPHFISEEPPGAKKTEGRLRDETRVSIISSIEIPGIRPHIFHIGISSKPSGEINRLLLEISDQPI